MEELRHAVGGHRREISSQPAAETVRLEGFTSQKPYDAKKNKKKKRKRKALVHNNASNNYSHNDKTHLTLLKKTRRGDCEEAHLSLF